MACAGHTATTMEIAEDEQREQHLKRTQMPPAAPDCGRICAAGSLCCELCHRSRTYGRWPHTYKHIDAAVQQVVSALDSIAVAHDRCYYIKDTLKPLTLHSTIVAFRLVQAESLFFPTEFKLATIRFRDLIAWQLMDLTMDSTNRAEYLRILTLYFPEADERFVSQLLIAHRRVVAPFIETFAPKRKRAACWKGPQCDYIQCPKEYDSSRMQL